jgi:hypothetical protein
LATKNDASPVWNKKRYGRCRICQKFGRLTREHVPPASAFNDRSYLQYYSEQVSEAERLQWRTREVNASGIYVFTLCERCNNKTGRAYGGAYVEFVREFSSVATPTNADTDVEIDFKNLFPARVAKQAVSMFLSTSGPVSFNGYKRFWNPLLDTTPPATPEDLFNNLPDPNRLRDVYDQLRSFVRKRDVRGLPPGVRLYAYAVANSGSGVQTGIMAAGRRSTNKYFWLIVVGLWPVHWVLVLDGEPDEKFLDVTDWANMGYKDRRSEKIQIPCRWTVGKFPLDFRSPKKFMRDGFTSRMRVEGLVLEPGIDEEQRFEEAISFARRRAKWTREGYLIAEFKTGVYFEAEGRRGWRDNMTRDQTQAYLRELFASVKGETGHQK